MHWAAVLAVTPVTPLPARAPVTTRVSGPTGDAQGSRCPCGFALRKGLQEGIRAVGILAHKGVGVAPLTEEELAMSWRLWSAGARRGLFLNKQTGWLLPRGLQT